MKFLLFLLLLTALPLGAIEKILSYHSNIEVKKNGDLLVTETIKVRSEGNSIKRGIFRDIPKLQHSKWGLKKEKPFEVLSVTRGGKDEPFIVEKIGQGGIRIRIGDKDRLLDPSDYEYKITYRTGKQLFFEDQEDALYWNVTGNEWAFPMDQVSATVTLPDNFEATRVWAYTGKKGAQEEDYQDELKDGSVHFKTTRPLDYGEGLTVVVRWPTGLLDPAAYEASDNFLKDHPSFFLSLFLILAAIVHYLFAWFRVGIDPAKGVIIPQFAPPPGFSPAAVRYLNRMAFDNTCFSANVVALAVKGALKIKQTGKTYQLHNLDANPALLPDEKNLFEKLLGSSKKVELKQANHKIIGGARKTLQKTLSTQLEKTHFVRNLHWWLPGLLLSLVGVLILVFTTGASGAALFLLFWLGIWTVGTIALISNALSLWRSNSVLAAIPASLFAAPFVIFWFVGLFFFFQNAGPWATGGMVVSGSMAVIFYHLIKAPTHLGRKIMDHIEGFKHYLSVAEEERLNLQNPPEKTPELFEKFLPYALALDCEQKWSQKFDAVLNAASAVPGQRGGYSPSFYSGSYTGMDRTMGMAALGGALTGALASSSSAPSSSGSSGGGSSGGGGGGGGGGGW